jgi:hypothetical protein
VVGITLATAFRREVHPLRVFFFACLSESLCFSCDDVMIRHDAICFLTSLMPTFLSYVQKNTHLVWR